MGDERLMPPMKAMLTALLLIGACAAARADRDIVYSARYYAPPRSHVTTRFHIYRIDPDGSRRQQITFGAHDDEAPVWSPDGNRIAFIRDNTVVGIYDCRKRTSHWLPYDRSARAVIYGIAWLGDRTVVANAVALHGRRFSLRIVGEGALEKFPNGLVDLLPSPAGRLLFAHTASATPCVVTASGATTMEAPKEFGGGVGWLDERTLASVDYEHGGIVLWKIGSGDTRVPVPRPRGLNSEESFPWPLTDVVRPIPGAPERILFPQDESNSTVRPNSDYYKIDLKTGATSALIRGAQFVIPSPDGKRFVTAPGRDTVPYARRKYTLGADGEKLNPVRGVWASPLQIGDMRTGAVRTIQGGLVWVTGADWKK
jgi:hypothetical protein